MERDIKDYLHLYHPQSGLRVMIDGDEIGTFEGVTSSMIVYVNVNGRIKDEYANYVKPILKKLSDMTEEEAEQISHDVLEGFGGFDPDAWPPKEIIAAYSEDGGIWDRFKPDETRWLLSHGFDLFNLIPDGLAIDATTINKATS